jgi:hypothetical protein
LGEPKALRDVEGDWSRESDVDGVKGDWSCKSDVDGVEYNGRRGDKDGATSGTRRKSK